MADPISNSNDFYDDAGVNQLVPSQIKLRKVKKWDKIQIFIRVVCVFILYIYILIDFHWLFVYSFILFNQTFGIIIVPASEFYFQKKKNPCYYYLIYI